MPDPAVGSARASVPSALAALAVHLARSPASRGPAREAGTCVACNVWAAAPGRQLRRVRNERRKGETSC